MNQSNESIVEDAGLTWFGRVADSALVVTLDFQKGGTWAGAIEQLERLHFVPVFVRSADKTGKGNAALLQRGARPWPDPKSSAEFSAALSAAAKAVAAEPKQETLSLAFREQPPSPNAPSEIKPKTGDSISTEHKIK